VAIPPIKLEARKAYGFRNLANQRPCSLCATTRRSRSALTPIKFDDSLLGWEEIVEKI
jgi:hypothetical protein